MKKILILASDMEIGGAERALLGLLEAIDKKQYQVDLFLLRHQGPFMRFIPVGVNLLPENEKYADLGVPIGKVLKKGHFDMVYGRMRGKYKAKRFIAQNHLRKSNSVEIHYSYKYTLNFLPDISEQQYDLALGFTIPYYILDKKISAKKKMVWIHTDYLAKDGDRAEELRVWSAYPYIASISKAVTKAFLRVYPDLESRIYPIDNIVSETLIQKQADIFDVEGEMPCKENQTCLLSIGRFVEEKNFENIPEICAKILQKGIDIKWYIIGFGKDEKLIEKKIRESKMEDHVIVLGKKDNPYPYIKKCDIYVQPSRYEGKAVAVREAQILHGVIVPMDNDGCAKGIKNLIMDDEKRKNLIKNCSSSCYSNKEEVEKIYALMC